MELVRRKAGPICPKCGSGKHYATNKPDLYRCAYILGK
jgi:hypothetical protein